jgi:hypothetical protein
MNNPPKELPDNDGDGKPDPMDVPNGSYFGVALDGVPIEAATAEFVNAYHGPDPDHPENLIDYPGDPAWSYEALTGGLYLGTDGSNGHCQPPKDGDSGGAYHYHGLPLELLALYDKVDQATGVPVSMRDTMRLLGYAADGYPIYSPFYKDTNSSREIKEIVSNYRLKQGQRPDSLDFQNNLVPTIGLIHANTFYDGTFTQDWEWKDFGDPDQLDECNGRTGKTPQYPQGTYYYVVTRQFPFFPRKFHGQPDETFNHN